MAKDPKEPLNKPVQETGSNHQMVKDFPKGRPEVSTDEKSTAIKLHKIADDNEETPPVEENGRWPKEQAGVEDGLHHVIKVSVETQTEIEFSEQSADGKPEPEIEKESDIKEMSTQTLAEGKDQLSPGSDVKGKKKKQRSRKKRPSKEKKEAQPIQSSHDTQSWSILFQFPITTDDIKKLAYTLFLLWFFCYIGGTQCSPVDNVKDKYHAYSFVTDSSLANATLDVKKRLKFLCNSVQLSQKEVTCNGSSIFLINETTLLLVTMEKSSYFVETGKRNSPNTKYEGVFSDPQSALKYFDPKGAQTARSVPTKSSQVQQTTGGLVWWEIILIVIGTLIFIAGVILTVVSIKRPCRGNGQNGSPPANSTELEPLGNSQVGNGTQRPATA